MAASADLRSDTVTRPTRGMRAAIAEAVVGDDVLGDDPTVRALQERVAGLLGKPAALFVPSGTMGNQCAIRAVCQPGDEVICDETAHSFNYESGGPAALAGASLFLLRGERGVFSGAQLAAAVRPSDDHFPVSRMTIVENTSNRGGGRCWPQAALADVARAAAAAGLHRHLDGARLMNAAVAQGCPPGTISAHFDSVSMCFSKGLGAPVGSILVGSEDFIRRAHRFRKMFGGGLRQVGVLAAAALYALDHHVERLADDHARARRLAEAIAETPGLSIDPAQVETNIVIFDVDPGLGPAAALAGRLAAEGVRVIDVAPQRIRAVTHLDVDDDAIEHAIATVRRVCAAAAAA